MKKGFTLIELLIVITIIGVLSGIGITIYQGIQAKARDSVRKQDLNKLALALELYNQKNSVYVPGSGRCSNDTPSFYNAIAEFMSDKNVPHDPSSVSQTVNGCSLDQLQNAFGTRKGDANFIPACDLNNDGQIDISDFGIFAKSLYPDYCYISTNNGSSYQLCAKLQNTADPDIAKSPKCIDTRYNYTVVPK